MSVDKEKKQQYNAQIQVLKRKVDEVNRKIKYLESKQDDNENLIVLQIASFNIVLVSIYCAMTDLSVNLLGYKNESYLDMGRKSLYKALILIEGVVSSAIDIPLNENYELLSSLEGFSDKERLNLLRKMGYTISLLQDRYGANSKWKWSFVEIDGSRRLGREREPGTSPRLRQAAVRGGCRSWSTRASWKPVGPRRVRGPRKRRLEVAVPLRETTGRSRRRRRPRGPCR